VHDLTSPDPSLAPRFPRPVALLIAAAVVGAAAVSLAWPSLTSTAEQAPPSVPTGVGVIRRQIDNAGGAGRVGAAAPEFEWNAPDGRTRRLGDLRGKVLVVNFWATWCVPCRQEMPTLDRLARQNADVVVLGVDLQEDGAKVREFFDRYELTTIQPLLDTDGATLRRWGVVSLPTTFFVDRDGVVRHVVLGGPMSEDAITTGITKARVKA